MKNKHFWIDKPGKIRASIFSGNKVTNLTNWKLTADEFYRASEIIYPQIPLDYQAAIKRQQAYQEGREPFDKSYVPSLDSVYFFNIGICLENMIKGILTYNDLSLISGKKIDKRIKSHYLEELAPDIPNLNLNESETDLLKFLTVNVIWYGKYPIPANAAEAINGSGHKIDEVRKTFVAIYNKLSRIMEDTGDLKAHLHSYQFLLLQ